MRKTRVAFILTTLSYWTVLLLLFSMSLSGWSKNQAADTSDEYLTLLGFAILIIPIVQFIISLVLKKNGNAEAAKGLLNGLKVNLLLLLLIFIIIVLLLRSI